MILITGATGNNGKELVRQLTAMGQPVRAFVRNPAEASRLKGPNIELAVGDFDQPETLDAALRGGPRPPSWWKFVSSVSMPEKFLPQLPYNERSQSDQGLGIPLKQPSTASLVLDLSIHRFVAGGSDH